MATKPRDLPIDIATSDLDEEISHTLTFVRAYPILASLVAPFEASLQEWLGLYQTERTLERAVTAARAVIIVIDDELDALAMKLSNVLLAEVGEKKRKSPRYLRYFDEPPSRLMRPLLGDQLKKMREWVPSLTDPQCSPPVRDCGQKLAALVQRADDAVKAMGEAEQALTDFQTLGPKKGFIDRLNALRLSAFAQIAELPRSQPELDLPASFANRFFLRDSGSRKPTIPELEESILQQRARLAKLEALLAKLVQEEEAEARLAEEAEMRTAMKALEEAEKQRAEAEKQVEAARARISLRKTEQ
ncbi:MAG: hypothetical protein IT372_23070 [Polyangiaceae bacterium]|nr:hypothetical protein [Polyangiaceae bacterium]